MQSKAYEDYRLLDEKVIALKNKTGRNSKFWGHDIIFFSESYKFSEQI